ncbi:hypothetical protein SAY86_006748 [Trapa natans]|uniref:Class II aldolase/adducin N-terminal domain-containing protein n=1 Tax=Trapa natans TaxID=22666 RepID=A0AAN7L6D6_TRANT|nr:hypothetical protein SAY86_006748 [Trapa natans]
MAAAAPAAAALHGLRTASAAVPVPQACMEGKPLMDTRILVSDLCRQFYSLDGASGTGGSITMKVRGVSIPKPDKLFAMSHSSIRKERMLPEDTFVLSANGSILSSPSPKPYPDKPPTFTDWSPLFIKLQAESYHYLFDAALKLRQPTMGLSIRKKHRFIHSEKPIEVKGTKTPVQTGSSNSDYPNAHLPRCVVLDIEGTTTPISFVTEVLFPYARDNVGRHLDLTYGTPETIDDIKLLRAQVEEDLVKGIAGAVPIPPDEAGKEEVIASVVSNVDAMIKADRKITALKQMQGHIWRTGFDSKELEGVVFDDVPEALEKWHSLGIKVYIYSSGSRLAQRLIFGNTNHGDLRKYLCGYFDTAVGNKRETQSYGEIFESLGVDKPSDVLFITDVHQEATAAKDAGLEVVVSVRPGNAPLPQNHGFKTITSFLEVW